ncbi:MAG: PspC domain-containing protein [Oscillibacter sp.]|nr:PspC domain-containing protein [Oscillibacter sp.]
MQKRLYRVEEGKMLAGVCGGIAEYFNIDPTIIRLIWAAVALCGGTGILAYLVAALIIPTKSSVV